MNLFAVSLLTRRLIWGSLFSSLCMLCVFCLVLTAPAMWRPGDSETTDKQPQTLQLITQQLSASSILSVMFYIGLNVPVLGETPGN